MPYYSSPFTFNFTNSLITVDVGVTDVDCIALYTATKVAQASQEGIIYDRIAKGSGLSILGPAVQVGLTVELLGAWQLQFPAGNYIARVAGGNLIGGPSGDPIAYSAGVQTLLIQSAASTVVQGGGGGSGSGNVGSGSIIHSFRLKDVATNAAIAGALITVTQAGVIIAYQRSDNTGLVQFALDSGSYAYAIAASGYVQVFGSFSPSSGAPTLVSLTQSTAIPPEPFVGLCNVTFAVVNQGVPLSGVEVTAELIDENPTVDHYLLSKQVVAGMTDANGICVLTLVQHAQFTRGGRYRLMAADPSGKVLHDRDVTVLNQSSANAEDLPDA